MLQTQTVLDARVKARRTCPAIHRAFKPYIRAETNSHCGVGVQVVKRHVSCASFPPQHDAAAAAAPVAAAAAAAREAFDGSLPQPSSGKPPCEPPVLQQEEHTLTHHGSQRRDEYHWLTQLGPSHPKVLAYLKAESQYTITCMAHTRQLQLDLQAALTEWQQQGTPPTADALDSGSTYEHKQRVTAQQLVQPDWLAGKGSLCYQQYRSFGWPGSTIGQYRFFSVPVNPAKGITAMMQCRAPAAATDDALGTVATARANTNLPPKEDPQQAGSHGGSTSNSCIDNSDGSSGCTADCNSSRSVANRNALPPGTLVLWDEARSSSSSSSSSSSAAHTASSSGIGGRVHSLAVSPDGGCLALTYSSSRGRGWQLALVSCHTGDLLYQPVSGVDGPLLWVQEAAGSSRHQGPKTAAETSQTAAAAATHQEVAAEAVYRTRGQQQQQHLVYVANDFRQVYCFPVQAVQASPQAREAAAATAALPAASPRLVFQDLQHVSLNIAAAAGRTFITVNGVDGLVRQVLHYTGGGSSSRIQGSGNSSNRSSTSRSSQLLPDDPQAWQVLLPAQAVAALLRTHPGSSSSSSTSSSSSSSSSSRCGGAGSAVTSTTAVAAAEAAAAVAAAGDDDPTARVAVQLYNGLAIVRHCCAAVPHGQCLLAQLDHQQLQQRGSVLWQKLLPEQPGLLLEAVFVSHSPSAAACSGSSNKAPLQLVVLGIKHVQQPAEQQQQQQQGQDVLAAPSVCQQLLQAQMYSLELQSSSSERWECHMHCSCTLPLPDAFFQLHGASWCPTTGELHAEFSSLVRPISKLTVNIERLTQQQQQQQVVGMREVGARTAPAEQAADEAAALHQVLSAPAAFQQSDYCTMQIAVPSRDGTAVPVSLAWHRERAQLPQHFVQAGTATTTGVLDSGTSGSGTSGSMAGSTMSSTTGSTLPGGRSHSGAVDRLPPMLLSCYGSYGIKESVAFNPELLQLLDGGWVVAVAHVRGGGWLGRAWAEAGRGMGKTNSVSDVLAVAQYVVQAGLCAPNRLCLQGSSAGGWLAASAMLQQPQWFAAVVLTVPCLDPLGLLIEQQQGQLELGMAEADQQVYHSIRSWAPYDLLEQLLYHTCEPQQRQQQQQDQQQQQVQQQQQLYQRANHLQDEVQSHSTQASSSDTARRQLQVVQLPHVLVRAALFDVEVPIADPVKALARMRRLGAAWQEQQRQGQQEARCDGGNHSQCTAGARAVHDEGAGDGVHNTRDRQLLLRVVPGGHHAYDQDIKESALKLAFLLAQQV